MRLLAFEAGAAGCSAALLRDGDVVVRSLAGPGQGDRLLPLIDALLCDHGLPAAGLDALAVGVGPGGFTGTRIALAAAKGLALALDLEVVPVTAFEAVAVQVAPPVLVVLDGGRGHVFCQAFGPDREALGPPEALAPEALASRLPLPPLAGSGAALVLPHLDAPARLLDSGLGAAAVARAAVGLGLAPRPAGDLKPLYLRPPDARPSAGAALTA